MLSRYRLWIAHVLTLSRIPIALALWCTWGEPVWSLALVGLAALTDTADGTVARWAKRRGSHGPDIGGWLDPLVDKLFVAIVLAAVWYFTRDLVVIALIGARELVLVPLTAVYLLATSRRRELRADPIGKAATIAQFVALGVVMFAPRYALIAAAVAAVLGLAAVVHYVLDVRLRRPLRHSSR